MPFPPAGPPYYPNPINGFFLLTGVSLAAFASGFGVCLFDISTVDQCVAVAEGWVDKFRMIGTDYLIPWLAKFLKAAFHW
jgi:hypothetical protein